MKQLQGTHIRSVGTVRNYEQALTRVTEWTQAERINGGLRALTPEHALAYLEARGETVGQKTLDMERQAIQAMFTHVTGHLALGEKLRVIKSEHEQLLASRAYTGAQVQLVAQAQQARHALATEIAYAAGLRAHELLTLQPLEQRSPDPRPAADTKWRARSGALYTVAGKGGLVRTVLLPVALAERLESRRLESPVALSDRGIHYRTHYDLGGGQRWSNAFSAASRRALGRSEGAHGLRHSYAQERMRELQTDGLKRAEALRTVSQEMGHFRPEITETYLR